ncbi:MAG: FHA domain-containing protein [Candidatus Calescibacterium sp.]|nr:FHA domain-containing protein [Candidatus Calescibacterium sp.]MDW8195376.1 FHA domain-containing protein [Candidatus Calescibacterium sp.]
MLVKICPSCGHKNKVTEILCISCMVDISGVKPTDSSTVVDQHSSDKREEILIIRDKNSGRVLELSSGDIIGRSNKGSDIFMNLSNPKVISRIHCQVIYRDGKWYIKDLNSTNNTFLNSVKLTPNVDYQLNSGDSINLAGVIEFIVEI